MAKFSGDKKKFLEDLEQALYAAKIVSYAQGFMLLREASNVHNWDLNYGAIALMWRGGCIIRSVFLGEIKKAFDKDPGLKSLLLDPFFLAAITKAQTGWRNVVSTAVNLGKLREIYLLKYPHIKYSVMKLCYINIQIELRNHQCYSNHK